MANKTEVKFLAKPVNHLYMLIISAGALTTLGLIMVFSASSIRAIDTQGSAISIVLRQLLFVLVSVPLAAYLSKLTVAKWEFLARIGFLLSLCILATLLIPGVGKTVNGNTNWVDLKIVDVQPSEFAKFLMILWASYLLARKENSGRFDTNVFSLIGPGFILIMAMVMYGHDLGTTSVIAAILAGLLFISGIPLRLFGTITAVGALILAAFIATSPYRAARFLVFLNPFAPEDYKYAGWQPAHSLLGLASGGLFGVGFIFSVIGEELGLVGTLTVLLLLLTMIYSTFRIALRAKEPMIRYACAGIGCWITVQAFLNIGSATSVLPVVGVTLPLVSYGGSALVATLCALGFVAGAALRDPAVRKEILKRRTQ
jgi:cell division protein FtsW